MTHTRRTFVCSILSIIALLFFLNADGLSQERQPGKNDLTTRKPPQVAGHRRQAEFSGKTHQSSQRPSDDLVWQAEIKTNYRVGRIRSIQKNTLKIVVPTEKETLAYSLDETTLWHKQGQTVTAKAFYGGETVYMMPRASSDNQPVALIVADNLKTATEALAQRTHRVHGVIVFMELINGHLTLRTDANQDLRLHLYYSGQTPVIKNGKTYAFTEHIPMQGQALQARIIKERDSEEALLDMVLDPDPHPVTDTKDKDLRTAAFMGQIETVRQLLKQGASVKARDNEGMTALMFAGSAASDSNHKNRIVIAKILLNRGAEVNTFDNRRHSVLAHAVIAGNVDCVRLLLSHKAQINTLDKEGDTPLLYACRDASISLVKLLVSHGARVNVRDQKGWTPLMYAAQGSVSHGHQENEQITRILLSGGADPNINDGLGLTAIKLAKKWKHETIVQLLRQSGARD